MAVIKRIEGWKTMFIDQIRVGRTLQEAAGRQMIGLSRIYDEFDRDSEFKQQYDDAMSARADMTGAECVRRALKW